MCPLSASPATWPRCWATRPAYYGASGTDQPHTAITNYHLPLTYYETPRAPPLPPALPAPHSVPQGPAAPHHLPLQRRRRPDPRSASAVRRLSLADGAG